MFKRDGSVFKSDIISHPSVCHAFSTREGGVSECDHTRSMNLSFGNGDGDGTVRENMRRLCLMAGVEYSGLIGSPQYHGCHARTVFSENALEGIEKENTAPSDAFVTDSAGVSLLVRVADCTPILFCGTKEDASPVVGAAHAGWKGTVGGIAASVVEAMVSLGCRRDTVKVAVGHCIHPCHFEVKDDFVQAVSKARGDGFAERHIEEREGRLFADLVSMNLEILKSVGIKRESMDVSPYCTACDPTLFHSHRATGGKRGTMGAVIGIVKR